MAKVKVPLDRHEWLSFEDPDEERTWVFDLTFLLSKWTCIFGNGCKGVLTEDSSELMQGCCSYGAHFTDDEDRERVLKAVETLTDEQWQFAAADGDTDAANEERRITRARRAVEKAVHLLEGASETD